MRKHLGNSMRPAFVPLVCYLKHMQECCLCKFQVDNMLENKWWNRGYSGPYFPALLLYLRGLVCWLLLYGIPINLGWNNLLVVSVLADAASAFSCTQDRHSSADEKPSETRWSLSPILELSYLTKVSSTSILLIFRVILETFWQKIFLLPNFLITCASRGVSGDYACSIHLTIHPPSVQCVYGGIVLAPCIRCL